MNIFQCAYLECIRKPIRSLIVFLIFILIFTGEMIGLSLLSTAQYGKENVLRQIGTKITFAKNEKYQENAPITTEAKDRIAKIQHVVGINQFIADFAQPIGFKNSKISTGIDPNKQKGSAAALKLTDVHKDSIVVEGNINVEWVDEFRLGFSKVIKGNYPTNDTPGVLVEQRLAEVNNLHVGDSITITTDRHQIKKSLKLIGIYHTKATFKITADNPLGADIYAHSPYNRVFTNLDSALQLFQLNSENLRADIYLDSPSNLNAVGKKIKTMDFDWTKFQLINTTETIYQQQAKQIDVLSNYSTLILFYISSFGVILLFLILSIWSKNMEYENGILIALGASKIRPIVQFFITTSYITIIAFLIAILVSNLLSNLITTNIIDATYVGQSLISSFFTGKELDTTIHVVQPNIMTYLIFICIVLGFLLASCLFPFYHLIRFKTKDILSKK